MDPNLKLKPIELIDIGIDKLTKIPVPILNQNIVSTFDINNGLPTDTFIFTIDATYSNFFMTITTDYDINLTFNYGDGIIETWLILSGGTSISHSYSSNQLYTITASGWLDKINSIVITPFGSTTGGITSASLNLVNKLINLDLSNNRLTNIDLSGLVYINTINLKDNYLTNDIIDDLYINADTSLNNNIGYVRTDGINNGKPSVYSDIARNSLDKKGWVLTYNT